MSGGGGRGECTRGRGECPGGREVSVRGAR